VSVNREELLRALEALLFVSDEPATAVAIAQALEIERREAEELCEELARRYEERDAGIVLRNVAGGWRLATHPDAAPIVERYVVSARHARLTKAALETLAIVAYKQPVTRHQVASIRGVNTDGVLRALSDRGLVAEVGRDERPGRPVLYGTTPEFLERLGLPSLSALPPLAPLLGNGDGAAPASLDEDEGQVSLDDRGEDAAPDDVPERD
jgi:segregation and condensation protein B